MAPLPAPDTARQQLSQDVATYVRELIISGRLRRGEFLRIETVAKVMGVSNTPVREGLLLLQSENFVRLVPRRGFVVSGFSKQDVRDLFWAQGVLAGELAARATLKMTPEEIAALDRINAEHAEAVAANDVPRYTRLAHQFHRGVNLAARSLRLATILGAMARQLPNRFYSTIEGQVKGTLHYHPDILHAIRRRDPEVARELMRQHIVGGAEHLIVILEAQGVWANGDGEEGGPAVDVEELTT